MEWLGIVVSCSFLATIKWVAMFVFYFCAAFLAIITGVLLRTTYEERKIWKGKDFGWKIFPVLAILSGISSFVFILLGNLLR